jgi:hypothetical protein
MSFTRLSNMRIASQEAINSLLLDNLQNDTSIFTTCKLMPPRAADINFEHFAMPMIHPTTGETIISYKKLINNPATQETWMTALQPHQLPWRAHHKKSRYYDLNITLEQHTQHAKGKKMFLNIKIFYLLAPLVDRYEYIHISIGLFPLWIIEQYDLNNKVYH